MKTTFHFSNTFWFCIGGRWGWVKAEKEQKLTMKYLAELGSADNTVTEPPIHTPPWEQARGKKPVWWGHQPSQKICQQRSWWAARGPLGFIRIISTSIKQWSYKEYCVGCLIVTSIVYLLPSFCNKICHLTMNDPCVRQQVLMAVTEGLQICSSTAWQGPITGAPFLWETLPLIEKQVPVGGYSQEEWDG